MAGALPLAEPARRKAPRRLLRALALMAGLLVAGAGGGALWLRSELRGSLPQLDGERAVTGLGAAVEIERDDLGVPTVLAASRADASRALGFLHAQDRFFQMDLLRRQAAGELAELFGPAAVDLDERHRRHRFRHRAQAVLERSAPAERAVLEAYAEGVNAGLAALSEKPFEYLAARAPVAPWRSEDSVLAVYAMFFELQEGDGADEAALDLLARRLPRPLFDFLAPAGTEWDAPLAGDAFVTPPVPGPEVFDLRARGERVVERPWPTRPGALEEPYERAMLGSNNWAVAGTRTADGRAWLANDMHLGFSLPNTWYRAVLRWRDEGGGERFAAGVTLPGTPSVVTGSNGHVAWGFTNTYGDWLDLIELEIDQASPAVYRTPEGPKALVAVEETIAVKGGVPVLSRIEETIWGPVIDEGPDGRRRALAWTAHHPEAVGFAMLGVESAASVDEAIAVAQRGGIPAQNLVVADDSGRIGWTVAGRIPRRVGFDGRLPVSWADGARRWDGWLAGDEVPRIVDPPSGQLWTANARTVDGEALARLGDGGYDLGARARQIRDGLSNLGKATPRDLLALQLDDRALFLERWRDLLLATLTPEAVAANARRAELRRLVETTWTGHAALDSVAYRATRLFRSFLAQQVFGALAGEPAALETARFVPGQGLQPTRQFEGPLWKLVHERPLHLLDPRLASWDEQRLAAVDAALDALAAKGTDLADRTWGERNTVRIQHPLSRAVPLLSGFLDLPPRQLPGDDDMPRVQTPAYGASERFVVSPGREEESFFHMPGGQSGHPLSPYYRKGHEAWERGEPTPFLPGPAVHRLRLVPGTRNAVAHEPRAHTYSIVARDAATGELGVAVQSHWFQVGPVVAWAEAGVGAVATQSFTRIDYGPLGLAAMKQGRSARQALDELLPKDPGSPVRQVAMVDAKGGVAAWTGGKCIAAAGHQTGDGYSVQANLMDRATVWPAMARAFESARGDLAERMLAALEAAEAEGGDIRGRQSAALVVVRAQSTGKSWEDRLVDLRVDDHPAPLAEIRRLIELHRAYQEMNRGDEALAANDVPLALGHYTKASTLAPQIHEIPFWQAVTLFAGGHEEEALPVFRRVFAAEERWARLVPRLPAAGLLPDDPQKLARILAQAP